MSSLYFPRETVLGQGDARTHSLPQPTRTCCILDGGRWCLVARVKQGRRIRTRVEVVVWRVFGELDVAEGLWELEVPRHPQCHFQARILLEWERAHLVLSSAEEGQEYHRRRSVCLWYKVEWKGIRQRSEREVCSISSLFTVVSLGEYIYRGHGIRCRSADTFLPFVEDWRLRMINTLFFF